jgi:uncharacterized protein (TIGR02145 family)
MKSIVRLMCGVMVAGVAMLAGCNKGTPPETPDETENKVVISKSTLELRVGKTETLSATVLPIEANQAVTWDSSSDAIATVDDAGLVTAIAEGTATITVKAVYGDYTDECTVTVVDDRVTGVKLNKSTLSLKEGSSETLIAIIEPEDASNRDVEWKSDDPTVATVDLNGNVVGVAPGETKITVTTVDGNFPAECTVTVTELPDHAIFGKVKFVSPTTWVFGDQEWSDAVTASKCRKSAYLGEQSSTKLVDCKQFTGHDVLFSWPAVDQYKDVLCPDGWRVPTKTDFETLDKVVNNVPESVARRGDQASALRMIDEWGGRVGGFCTYLGESVGMDAWGHYWTQTGFDGEPGYAYIFTYAIDEYNINTQFTRNQHCGLAVRCVREVE